MNPYAIRCSNLSKSFGGNCVVRRVALDLKTGSFLALLGASGCGKTTTLRLLAGFEKPDSGTIEIQGRTVAGAGTWVSPEKRQVGMVFQDYALFPHLTVAQNVGYGIRERRRRGPRVLEILKLVGLQDLGSRFPGQLSGGQQQRVALARALAPAPAVILLDEPFSNLDAERRAQVRSEVREILKQAGATAIFVSHDQEEALSLADQIAVMHEGRILQTSTPQKLFQEPASPEVATFLGETNLISGQIRNGAVHCPLGSFPVNGRDSGNVQLLLRKTHLTILDQADGEGRILERNFYGSHCIYRVAGPGGLVLQVRTPPEVQLDKGERVRIRVEHPPLIFD